MARIWLLELEGTAQDLGDLALVLQDDRAEITREGGHLWLKSEADFDGAPPVGDRARSPARHPRGVQAPTVSRSNARTGFGVWTMGSKAEYVQRFTKGQRVLVIGRLEIGEWTTRDNEVRTSYGIWADDVVNLSPREDGGRSHIEPSASSAPNERAAQPAGAGAR